MQGPAIVCIGSTCWHGLNHRPHHIMRGLAKLGWSILYVNPPITWLSPLKDQSQARRWTAAPLAREVEPGILVLDLPVSLPFGSLKSLFNFMNQHRIARILNTELTRLHISDYILYTLLPSSADLLPLLDGRAETVYDCVDDHAAFSGLVSKNYIRRLEARLAKSSAAVFATSKKLYDRLLKLTPNVHLLKNGVHVNDFAMDQETRNAGLAWRKSLQAKTVAGFVGGIGDWIDTGMITDIAKLRPATKIVLVGPILKPATELQTLANVLVLGEKPYRELPFYLSGMDVGLAPFVQNELTESVDPLKVYEYLAAGLEVIATPMPELVPLQDVLHFGATAEAFVAHLDNISAGKSATSTARRLAVARDRDWDLRISEIDQILKSLKRG